EGRAMRNAQTMAVLLLLAGSVTGQAETKGESPPFFHPCPSSAEFGQTPLEPASTAEFAAVESSNSAVLHYESYSDLAGPIVLMRWWGTYFDDSVVTGPGPCSRTGITFVIK